MTRLMSVKDTDWAFYEAMESESVESMADYYETLKHHYKRRGVLLKEKDIKYWSLMRKWREDIERKERIWYEKVQELILKHPHSSNYMIDGELQGVDSVMLKELKGIFNQ